MFRLVNVGGRAAFEHAGGVYDVARLAGDESLSTAPACLARLDELHDLARRCEERRADGLLADVVLGPPVPERPPGLRHRTQLPEPRRRERHGAAAGTAHLHQVPELPGRPDR